MSVIAAIFAITTPIIPSGVDFPCTPVAVWDGDGPIWCAEGPKIRLSGIAAREHDESCRPGQPCPAATGRAARDGLVRLLGGPRGTLATGHIIVQARAMRCHSVGPAGGSRTAAWCVTAGGLDVSCAMVKSGLALRWERYWHAHRCR